MKKLLLGAHTSAAGGAHHALLEGEQIGATTIQFFTSNQKQWQGRSISEEEIALWNEQVEKTGIRSVMSHDSYLINLGSPDPELRAKSRKAFQAEIQRCHLFHVTYMNFHPGAATKASEEECLDQIVASLLDCESLVSEGKTRLLIETTAGQGTSVGHRFEHLAYLIERTERAIPIGVCIDTCHIFSAGYDIRTEAAWNATLEDFDRIIGLKHLYAMHLNDSMKPFGDKKDRHAPLGEGEIGLDAFRFVMKDSRLRELPKYLETPGGPPKWKEEIAMLRMFASE